MLRADVQGIVSCCLRELKSIGDNVRDAAGPWTVKTKSSAGSQAGEEVDIEVEISLPSLDGRRGAFL